MREQKRKGRAAFRPWVIIGALVAMIIAHVSGIARPLETVIAVATNPIQAILYSATTPARAQPAEGDAQRTDRSKEDLISEIEGLESRVDELLIENAQLKTLVQESTLLEEQVDFLSNRSLQGVPAKVIARPTDGIAQSVIMNRGSSDGIQEGYPVIIQSGALVGIVHSVDGHFSEVRLLTNFGSRVSANVQNDARSPGIVSGEHNLAVQMELIPQPDILAAGDSVVTSGNDPFIPQGLIIGTIEEVKNEPGSLFQAAVVQPLFTAQELTIATIIVP